MGERVVRLTIAYDGTGFRGWARQRDPGIRTIEGVLTDRLETVLREPVKLSVAGRTDAGVHARAQVASFRTSSTIAPEQLRSAVNAALAPEVAVFEVSHVPAGFDARFSATGRAYAYRIHEAEAPDPFTWRYVWHRPGRLALRPMREAARALVGTHDFSSFCRRPGEGRSTVRTLRRLTVARRGDLLEVRAEAEGFLHQMVRSLVGTLVAAGEGRIEPDEIPAVLAARDRSAAGRPAPARGLTLERVTYGRRL
ncbi:MAG TPA: tRNA pseudouridine(38-40) synthase TruA [Actinomycetota bacterium]|jgi:tRNA pseudouridine38-40 synthase|nr:tRNA pseudouridine(38-40) synthase TruA [Actinomycetota bacterium]